jgi:phage terminase small subunit
MKTKKPMVAKINAQQKRFCELYLGSDGGVCWSNATLSYLWAYNGDNFPTKDEDGQWTTEYLTAKANGYRSLEKKVIKDYMDYILLEVGMKPEEIKKGIMEWAKQKKHPVVSLNAYEKIAKITGVLKEDTKTVDLPELVALTAMVQSILTPKK